MDNIGFVDKENIPMVHDEEDYNERYDTPDTSRIETLFIEPDAQEFLGVDKMPPVLERSVRAATKLKGELPTYLQMESIPLKDLLSLAEDVHFETREAIQNTDLDMREFLGIDKALQSIQGELVNNTSKLTEIDKRIEKDTKNLKEIQNDPI